MTAPLAVAHDRTGTTSSSIGELDAGTSVQRPFLKLISDRTAHPFTGIICLYSHLSRLAKVCKFVRFPVPATELSFFSADLISIELGIRNAPLSQMSGRKIGKRRKNHICHSKG
jgi:hypothetical protein